MKPLLIQEFRVLTERLRKVFMAKSPSLSNYHDNNHTPGAGAPGGATFQPIYDIGEVVLIDELLRTDLSSG